MGTATLPPPPPPAAPYSGAFYPPPAAPMAAAVAPIVPVAPAFVPPAASYMLAPTMMGGYGVMPSGGDYGEPNAKKMKVEASEWSFISVRLFFISFFFRSGVC